MRKIVFAVVLLATLAGVPAFAQSVEEPIEYRLFATTKTSTMEKEMNAASQMGFRYQGVMGGETAFGGQEVVLIMQRRAKPGPQFEYRLLATNKTSTMQREMQDAADAGYEYAGQTVFESMWGGREVVVILERVKDRTPTKYEYRLLATSKTSTMQKELAQAGSGGFEFVGLTVAQTATGGNELVVITRRLR